MVQAWVHDGPGSHWTVGGTAANARLVRPTYVAVIAMRQQRGDPASPVELPLRHDSVRHDSFENVWRLQHTRMLQLAYLLVDSREAAEDAVQDAFLGLHRRWGQVTNPNAYLRASVTNACRSALRRRRLARLLAPTQDLAEPAADDKLLLTEEHAEVLRALQRLQPRHREVLILKYWQDLSDDDVAATLRISPSAVRAAATRGRQALALELRTNR
jgi:RNA polymerase sigma factor (sigma-70 family)